jgi:hypothetical protein
MVRLFLTTALAAAPVLWAGAAAAQCTPDAPANGATVTCTGTDANGFVFGGDTGLDGINLLVGSGATVTNGGNRRGIDLRDSANIVVFGTVSSPNSDGIRARNNATVSLNSTARVTGGDEAMQLGDNATVNTIAGSVIDAADEGIEAGNDAQVTHRGTLTAIDDALQVGERATIQNLGRIANIQTQAMITAGDEAQDGIDLDSGLINNGGFSGFTANANAEVSSTFGDAIDFDVSTNPVESVIDNYALIRGGNHAVETDALNVSGQWVINRATGRIIGGGGTALNLGAGADRYDHFAGAALTGGIDFGSGDDILQILGMPTGRLGGAGAVIDGGTGSDRVFFDSFAFDQIAGSVSGTTIDLRIGTGPSLFQATLANFEQFFFADSENPRSFADVARRLAPPEVVPLPASALLLLGGLGGLAALRRRKAGRAGR